MSHSWLQSSIPLWQLAVAIGIYVIYREVVKLAFKHTVKFIKGKTYGRQGLQQPEYEDQERPTT